MDSGVNLSFGSDLFMHGISVSGQISVLGQFLILGQMLVSGMILVSGQFLVLGHILGQLFCLGNNLGQFLVVKAHLLSCDIWTRTGLSGGAEFGAV